MRLSIASVLVLCVMLLGARSASAAVTLDCFSFQADNETFVVPGSGTVDVVVTGSGGAWVEILPFDPTDTFRVELLDTSGNVIDTNSGANGYSRTYLRTGSGTVRVRSIIGLTFSAVAACKNAFPRRN
jgi:hypothetical protein